MNKRFLSIALTLCMVLTLLTTTAFADTPISDFRYTVSEETGEVTITGYNGSDTDVVIPGEIDGYTVTAIGTYAFLQCQSLTGITLPNSVTSIGIQTFNSCTSLKNINIPDGVTSIGTNAFANCTSLESIDIPDSVTYIGDGVFFGCSKLTSVTLSGSFTSIGQDAFSGCSSLTSIIIPNSVISIGQHAFSGCSKLTSVTLSDSLTSIGERAFNSCANLTGIEIPSNVTSVGNSAFAYCTNIESVFLPNGLDVTNAKIQSGATKVKYSLNNGKVTVDTIDLGTGKTSDAIPETICGYPVVAVAESEQSKVGEHKCPGDTATCINPKTCSICGISFSPHSYTNEDTTIEGALKTAGTCKTEAVYYYSCINCDSVEKDDSHTFTGSLDSDNHAGTKVWEQNETQHKQYWNCCDAVVIDYEDHTWSDGVCSVCDYICAHNDTDKDHLCDICGVKLSDHSGGEANCKDLAVCGYCGEKYGDTDSSNHNLEKIPAKAATVTEAGNKEYWHCLDCGKYFGDENGENEIHLADTATEKLPPEITDGEGQSVTEGEKKALTFRSNAAFSDFIRVELDGKTLDEKNYTKKEGSILVTLKADYVASLSAGEHTIGIVSESGTATTTFTVNAKTVVNDDTKSPQTGDNSNMALWIALLFVGGAGVIGTAAYSKRKKRTVR